MLAEPFDTKRGFSIVEQNGLEIFIFQLEKIDSIQKELLAFAGLDSKIEFKRAMMRQINIMHRCISK